MTRRRDPATRRLGVCGSGIPRTLRNSAIPTRKEVTMTGEVTWPGFRLPLLLRRGPTPGRNRNSAAGLLVSALLAAALAIGSAGTARAGDPRGQVIWGVHVTLAPTWF